MGIVGQAKENSTQATTPIELQELQHFGYATDARSVV